MPLLFSLNPILMFILGFSFCFAFLGMVFLFFIIMAGLFLVNLEFTRRCWISRYPRKQTQLKTLNKCFSVF